MSGAWPAKLEMLPCCDSSNGLLRKASDHPPAVGFGSAALAPAASVALPCSFCCCFWCCYAAAAASALLFATRPPLLLQRQPHALAYRFAHSAAVRSCASRSASCTHSQHTKQRSQQWGRSTNTRVQLQQRGLSHIQPSTGMAGTA